MPLRSQVMMLVAAILLAGTFVLAETNQPPPAPAAVTVHSDMNFIAYIPPSPFRLVAWTAAILLGTPTILVTYGLAWRARRKNRPTAMQRKVILITTLLIFVTGFVLLLLSVAEAFWRVGTVARGAAAQNMICVLIGRGCHHFALSVTVSTVGILALLTMPSERKPQ